MAAQRLVWRFSNFPVVKVEQRTPSLASLYSTVDKEMSFSLKSAAAATNCTQTTRKLPILLFDIMDTIVRDPFYHDVPAFFGDAFISEQMSYLAAVAYFVVELYSAA